MNNGGLNSIRNLKAQKKKGINKWATSIIQEFWFNRPDATKKKTTVIKHSTNTK